MKKKQPKKKAPLRIIQATGYIITSKGTVVNSAPCSEPEPFCKTC